MLTTSAALKAVLAATPTLSSARVPAASATGRVLRQLVRAERDQPPFDRVMMDGIAFAWSDYDGGLRRFPVQALQAAGDEVLTLKAWSLHRNHDGRRNARECELHRPG